MNGLYHTPDLPLLLIAVGSFGTVLFSTICTKRRRSGKNSGRSSSLVLSFKVQVARVVLTIFLSLTIAIAWFHRDTRPQGSRAVSGGILYVAIAYGILLTLLPILGRDAGYSQLTRHADLVFLGIFGTIAYHDLWPFFTVAGLTHPLDVYNVVEDALLGILGIIIPLTSPRIHRPLNDALPLKEPHPEQTASSLSLLLYSWLDPLISVAYKSQHLAPDALFPLADSDHVAELVSQNAPHLKSRGPYKSHIFFGLIRVFSSEYTVLVFLAIVQVILNLANPFALGQFLAYMETQGKGATIRPIVWVMLLFISPVMYSIISQWSIFIQAKVAVHIEVLLSDLMFKHALRTRLQGDGNHDTSGDNASSQETNLIGSINNHVTTDLASVTAAKDFLPTGLGVPLQIILCIAFLYRILGWSALVGATAMMILFPVPGYFGSLFQSVEIEKMKKTDARVQLVSETMNILRMIKLFGWERKMSGKIQEQRMEELAWTRKRAFLDISNKMVNFMIPIVSMLTTYSVYTLVAKQNLTASIVFSSVAVFDLLSMQLHVTSYSIPAFIQGKVALDRINAFLSHDDVVDELPEAGHEMPDVGRDDTTISDALWISHANFSWAKSEPETETHNKPFTLSIDDELVFQREELNIVTGPTGSGKTSLLMALLGEMHFHPSGPSSSYNLPRHLGVAYAAQESWILNRTIRDNIIFSSDFHEERYSEVLLQCALKPDLALMEHGDLTEVGERGVTLSGGQKARITLARAIYSSAQVILLDDVFAALDVHTSQWIVNHCFRGKLVQGRTIIMATHHVSLVNDIARYVVTLDSEGHVQSHGPPSAKPDNVRDVNLTDADQSKGAGVDAPQSDSSFTLGSINSSGGVEGGMLTKAEEIAEGHVGWSAVLLYLLGWGGRAPVLNWSLFVLGLFATHISKSAQAWYLGHWAEQYKEPSTVNVGYHVTVYTWIMSCTVIIYSLSCTLNLFGSLRASKTIHDRLIERIFEATFRWLDTTPVARVITRCTQDIAAVDGPFSSHLAMIIEMTIWMLVNLAAVVYLSPPFLLPGLIIWGIGGWCGQVYMKAELSVKRELSNAKAPLLAHLGAVLAGLVSVRAFGAQSSFIREYHSSIDHYTRVARTFYALNCWVSVRLEALGAMFTATLAAYLMYGHHNINPSNVGFSLNLAVDFSGFILWWIITYNTTEINANSLERIASYIEIEKEAEPVNGVSPPAYWPASGDLRVENLSARYSNDGPNVLHNLTFHVRTGERIGIIGRTGSGKTSLTLALLRCLFTEGEVYYDGILTSSVALEVLRSSLTIIPQSAELLNGTIRQNLDPFDQHDDATLHDALRAAGLSELQGSDGDAPRLTLDTPVTAGGSNLSVGQRQIIALARAMVRESKLLVLDEATSAIDHETDAVIQRTLREMKGVTQLTVAHRLRSIMDTDRIMVLDAGRIVELDTPSQLLQREDGIFRTIVYASKDKEALLAMVKPAA